MVVVALYVSIKTVDDEFNLSQIAGRSSTLVGILVFVLVLLVSSYPSVVNWYYSFLFKRHNAGIPKNNDLTKYIVCYWNIEERS